MFARQNSSPSREDSPGSIVNDTLNIAPPARKRKHAAISSATFSSPAPPDPPETEPASTSTDAVHQVLPAGNDLASRPRLTISRGPIFIPTAEGSQYHTTEHLMNRLAFRYMPAGLSPAGSVLPCRTIESNPTSYRVSWEDRSLFVKVTTDGLGLAGDKGFRSARCNAPIREGRWYMEVKVEVGGGDTVGETNRSEGSHVRLGWGRREAPLNGPVGLDGYSYGVRDKTGEKVTLSRPRRYGRSFTSGDVVGMYISLPPRRQAEKNNPYDPAQIKRERIAIEFKGQEYFEAHEYTQSKEMIALMDFSSKTSSSASVPSSSSKKSATVKNLPERGGRSAKSAAEPAPLRPLSTLPGSCIAFFVNGECQGIAFQDIYDYLQLAISPASQKGKERRRNRDSIVEHKHKENPYDDGTLGYYPFISLFNDARVRMNPGPDFEFPPPPDIDAVLVGSSNQSSDRKERTWRPVLERYPEFMQEQWALDAEEEKEAKANAAMRAAQEEAEAAKKAQKEKRKLQAEARKKAKKAAEERESSAATTLGNEERFLQTPGLSPLKMSTFDFTADEMHFPAPTVTSSVDPYGPQSGYNSDNVVVDGDDMVQDASVTYEETSEVFQDEDRDVGRLGPPHRYLDEPKY